MDKKLCLIADMETISKINIMMLEHLSFSFDDKGKLDALWNKILIQNLRTEKGCGKKHIS